MICVRHSRDAKLCHFVIVWHSIVLISLHSSFRCRLTPHFPPCLGVQVSRLLYLPFAFFSFALLFAMQLI